MAKAISIKKNKLLPKEKRTLKFQIRNKKSCHLCGRDFDSKTSGANYCDVCLEESVYYIDSD